MNPTTFAHFMPLVRSKKFRSILKVIAWVIVVQFILLNISAALYAYKFTHFYNSGEYQTSSQNVLSKTWRLFAGPKFYKATKEKEPDFPFETIQLETKKGLAIHAWYSTVDSSKACVILLHGVSVNKSYVVSEAEAFRQLGYNVLLIDFRGHGLSDGNTTTFGDDETLEVKAAFHFATSKGNQKIILYGTSLGAVVAIKAAADKIIKPHAIVAEMPFGSLQDHLEARARIVGFPSQPFAFFVTLWMGIERGYNGFGHNTSAYAKDIDCPVLLQWGDKDQYVSKEETYSVFDNLSSQKKLVTYAAGHESLLKADATKWYNEVAAFLQTAR